MSAIEKTMFTAVDAFAAKKSATTLGYYQDKYLECLQLHSGKTVRKQPVINRGYYTRVVCFRKFVNEFLESTKSKGLRQIINLGCGYDTLSFHLLDECHERLSIFEVDYEEVITRKTDMIRRSPVLNDMLEGSGDPLGPNYGFHTEAIKFVASDLQDPKVIDSLVAAGLDSTSPTLIISECVLVCTCLMTYLAGASVVWLSYDMFNPTDTFGKMMRTNIEASGGYRIPGFTDFPTLESHNAKFVNIGFSADSTVACSMLDAYNGIISDDDKRRLQTIERFDEVEEWELLMSHYSLLLGIKSNDQAIGDLLRFMP